MLKPYLMTLLAALTVPPAAAETLLVELSGIRDARGQVRVGLYQDAKTFRKEAQALAVKNAPAAPGDALLRFDDLPAGRYAVMAYHDEDGNGELNRRFGMFPTEGYGLSNNPQVSGPPAFDECAFTLSGPETRLRIELRY